MIDNQIVVDELNKIGITSQTDLITLFTSYSTPQVAKNVILPEGYVFKYNQEYDIWDEEKECTCIKRCVNDLYNPDMFLENIHLQTKDGVLLFECCQQGSLILGLHTNDDGSFTIVEACFSYEVIKQAFVYSCSSKTGYFDEKNNVTRDVAYFDIWTIKGTDVKRQYIDWTPLENLIL